MQIDYTRLLKAKHLFFIGIAGAGMSALAQYAAGKNIKISGSDRQFTDSENDALKKLEALGIHCFPQNGSGVSADIDFIVVSTAIENTNPEIVKANELNIPVAHRSDLLAAYANSTKTVAVGGTSGKSTTVAMIYQILEYNGLNPSLITGAGLSSLQKKGLIGNGVAGSGDWLVIEADESDGSIIKYTPEIGVLLNIDKDHKELDELESIFLQFKKNTKTVFISNENQVLCRKLSPDMLQNFGYNTSCGFEIENFEQTGFAISFSINNEKFSLNTPGLHNAENAAAATAAAFHCGISIEKSAEALQHFEGIYRRMQILYTSEDLTIIDDYAHNPAKLAAAFRAVQSASERVILWFQPHGFAPTRFLRNDFVQELEATARPNDLIVFSEIYYAGGTVTKDISANDLINDLINEGVNALFVEDKSELHNALRPYISDKTVILLCGARDPDLEHFTKEFARLMINDE